MAEIIETLGHTSADGTLNLSVNVGLPNADVAVTVHVRSVSPRGEVDEHGWPIGFFDRVAGSIPDLERPPQGEFESRLSLE